jgi:hypothetical protein
MGLKEFIPFFKEGKKEIAVDRRDELRTLQDKLKIYERIIERYKDYIEKNEAKNITDLKSLVMPNDDVIQKKKDELIQNIRPYVYDQNFLKAAELAHSFIREIRTCNIAIDFWLTPKELMSLKGGDPMDKAVFLCSLLIALENQDSYVIVGVDKGIKVGVGFIFNKEFHIIDPASSAYAKGEKEKIIDEWFKGDKRIYEFNDRDYSEIKSEETE